MAWQSGTAANHLDLCDQLATFLSTSPDLLGGRVTSVTVTAGGSGYTSAPTVAFAAPPAGGTQALGTAVLTSGAVTGVTITDPGSGYTSAPAVTFSGGTGTGAAATSAVGPVLNQQWTVERNSAYPNPFPWPGRLAYSQDSSGYVPASGYGTTGPDAPPANVPRTYAKMRYSGTLVVPTTGDYQFSVIAVEQCEVRIDGVLVFGVYANNVSNTFLSSFTMTGLAAGNHTIQVDHFNRTDGWTMMSLGWKKPGDSAFSIIPSGNYSGMTCSWGYADFNETTSTGFQAVMADKEYAFKGPGLSQADTIYAVLRTSSDYTGDKYNVKAMFTIGEQSGQPTDNWPGALTYRPHMTLWNQSMKYWFIANGRRFIVIAKVSTIYANMYGGFYLPYGLPTEIPYPICIGANARYNTRWSASATDTHSFWNQIGNDSNGNYSSMILRRPSSTLCTFQTSVYGATDYRSNYSGRTFPYYNNPGYRTSSDNNYGLIPIALYDGAEGGNLWGELDDVYHVSGFQNASENIITINSQDYLVVQGSSYTGINDYAAIALR